MTVCENASPNHELILFDGVCNLCNGFVQFVIAHDPVRFRPIMIPSVFEKISYASALIVLYLQHRIHAADLVFAGSDFVLGLLFLTAFFKTRDANRSS